MVSLSKLCYTFLGLLFRYILDNLSHKIDFGFKRTMFYLLQHGTCPVCRKTLDGKDTKTDETTVLSEMEQMATSAQARDSEESSQNNAPTFYDMEEYD